ncbi:MAG: F0F1 ATP synthase subunit A [Pirellulaceae bacterium]
MAERHDPLDPNHLIDHVKDSTSFHVPRFLAPDHGGHLELPVFYEGEPLAFASDPTGLGLIAPLDLRPTRYMVLEVVAAVLIALVFIAFSMRIKNGRLPKGRLANLLESMLLFIRDQVARPAIGHHDADRFVPFLWTLFFFVLACNLLGMVPWLGSPTGAIATTGALAFSTFCVVVGSGMKKLGVVGFWKAQIPHMDLPGPMAIFIKPMVFAIEVLGLFIKHFVLAVRLLANMAAGHLVLAVLVGFVGAVAYVGSADSYSDGLFWLVSIPSVFGAAALSLLELFVAFLQAYIFTFLSALFIGAAVHPH